MIEAAIFIAGVFVGAFGVAFAVLLLIRRVT